MKRDRMGGESKLDLSSLESFPSFNKVTYCELFWYLSPWGAYIGNKQITLNSFATDNYLHYLFFTTNQLFAVKCQNIVTISSKHKDIQFLLHKTVKKQQILTDEKLEVENVLHFML